MDLWVAEQSRHRNTPVKVDRSVGIDIIFGCGGGRIKMGFIYGM